MREAKAQGYPSSEAEQRRVQPHTGLHAAPRASSLIRQGLAVSDTRTRLGQSGEGIDGGHIDGVQTPFVRRKPEPSSLGA